MNKQINKHYLLYIPIVIVIHGDNDYELSIIHGIDNHYHHPIIITNYHHWIMVVTNDLYPL